MAVRQRTRLKRAPKTVIPDFPGHMADTTPTQPSFETDRSGLPCRRLATDQQQAELTISNESYGFLPMCICYFCRGLSDGCRRGE